MGPSEDRRGEMGRQFKETGEGSFFGGMIYERAVPEDHFLRKLDKVVDWEAFTELLIRLYKGGGEVGRPPYDPAVILKMLVLSYLYDLTERQTEVYVNDSMSAKWFLGLAADERAPDHSTLTRFKDRIITGGGETVLAEMLAEVVKQAIEGGVKFGTIQVVDSTHTIADVNTKKDEARQKRDGKPPRDGGARWGVKKRRRYRNAQGKTEERVEYVYSYKSHTTLNAEAEMITSVIVTGGNAHDGHQFAALVARDREQGLPAETYAADRGYDDTENHYLLEHLGVKSAIKLNAYRTKKKDKNKKVWIDLLASPEYQAGQQERYKIERKYGEGKVYHGWRRCRYLGRARYAIQANLTAIVLNLKRMVKLLTGVPFRGTALARA
jgi:IS5 family transposase